MTILTFLLIGIVIGTVIGGGIAAIIVAFIYNDGADDMPPIYYQPAPQPNDFSKEDIYDIIDRFMERTK